jgi:hypothetical protein
LGLLSVLLLLDEDPESLLLAQLDALADHKGELRHYPTESAQRRVDEPNQQEKKERKKTERSNKDMLLKASRGEQREYKSGDE